MAHILLVDDDSDVVSRNRAALEASGNAVSVAATTAQALDEIRSHTPDLVVLEAMLDGGLAGFDLARTLAKEFPALHLIMVSRVDEHLTAKQRAAQDRDDGWMPVDRFMEKPLSPDVLVYEVDHLVGAAH
jgi:DNA-binding response OmpR family regulator